MRKVIIAGSRGFDDYLKLSMVCVDILGIRAYPTGQAAAMTEIVSGGARGADTLGEKFAEQYGSSVKSFPADWDKHGKSAGYIRNEAMAEYANVLIAFWDGESRGTKHMIDLALKHGLDIHVFQYKYYT